MSDETEMVFEGASPTGNPTRDRICEQQIKLLLSMGEDPTFENVTKQLAAYPDFDYDPQEHERMLVAMGLVEAEPEAPPQVVPEVAAPSALSLYVAPLAKDTPPKSLEKIEPPREAEPAAPSNSPADATPRPDPRAAFEARAALDACNRRLDKLRSDLVVAKGKLKEHRADLAQAIFYYQQLGTPQQMTREQLVRDTIAANQKYKQDVKDGKVPPPRRPGAKGKSYIDQINGHYGDANSFVHGNMQESASTQGKPIYKGYRRQAFGANLKGRQVRVPSDQ